MDLLVCTEQVITNGLQKIIRKINFLILELIVN